MKTNGQEQQNQNDGKEKKPRRHHYLPISFLNRFCNEQGHVHTIDFVTQRPFVASPRNVANARDYYSAETVDDANDTSLESEFSKIEGLAKPGMDRIIERGYVDRDSMDWDYLCNFIALLDRRVPIARTMNQSMADSFAMALAESLYGSESKFQQTKSDYESATGKQLDFKYDDAHQLLEEGKITMELHQNNHIEYLLKSASLLVPIIGSMTPHLLIAKEHDFITGDTPVVKRDLRNPNIGRWAGWGEKSVQVAVPIGRHHCLLFDRSGIPCTHRATERNVAAVNTTVAHWALRFVFGATEKPLWISPQRLVRRAPGALIRAFAKSKENREIKIEGANEKCKALIRDAIDRRSKGNRPNESEKKEK